MQFCIFNSSLVKEIEKNSGDDKILIWNALYNWGGTEKSILFGFSLNYCNINNRESRPEMQRIADK